MLNLILFGTRSQSQPEFPEHFHVVKERLIEEQVVFQIHSFGTSFLSKMSGLTHEELKVKCAPAPDAREASRSTTGRASGRRTGIMLMRVWGSDDFVRRENVELLIRG